MLKFVCGLILTVVLAAAFGYGWYAFSNWAVALIGGGWARLLLALGWIIIGGPVVVWMLAFGTLASIRVASDY